MYFAVFSNNIVMHSKEVFLNDLVFIFGNGTIHYVGVTVIPSEYTMLFQRPFDVHSVGNNLKIRNIFIRWHIETPGISSTSITWPLNSIESHIVKNFINVVPTSIWRLQKVSNIFEETKQEFECHWSIDSAYIQTTSKHRRHDIKKEKKRKEKQQLYVIFITHLLFKSVSSAQSIGWNMR